MSLFRRRASAEELADDTPDSNRTTPEPTNFENLFQAEARERLEAQRNNPLANLVAVPVPKSSERIDPRDRLYRIPGYPKGSCFVRIDEITAIVRVEDRTAIILRSGEFVETPGTPDTAYRAIFG